MNHTLSHWNPLRELEDFQNRILKAFNPSSARRDNSGRDSLASADWMPLADIAENDKQYLITVELPEVNKQDVKVTVESGVLTVTGERKFGKEEENKKWHRVERSYGSFARSFALPEDGDAAKVTAEFKDGMLKVGVAKREQAQPKQIEVKVN